jgi:hypothetical protein
MFRPSFQDGRVRRLALRCFATRLAVGIAERIVCTARACGLTDVERSRPRATSCDPLLALFGIPSGMSTFRGRRATNNTLPLERPRSRDYKRYKDRRPEREHHRFRKFS